MAAGRPPPPHSSADGGFPSTRSPHPLPSDPSLARTQSTLPDLPGGGENEDADEDAWSGEVWKDWLPDGDQRRTEEIDDALVDQLVCIKIDKEKRSGDSPNSKKRQHKDGQGINDDIKVCKDLTTTTTFHGTTTSTAAEGTTTTITVSTAAANITTATSTGTTISSLSGDDLREIFLRLPDLPALVRAALTCRSWLGAVRASHPFRRLFRALHPAPLIIGTFLQLAGATYPVFAPLRLSGGTDVTAILRNGDFLLSSLPHSPLGWTVADCRDGCILLYNNDTSLAILNPMTWAVDILPPLECCLDAGSGDDGGFTFLGVHLHFSDEKPWLFRVIYVYKDQPGVRFATFSSKTWDWDIHPWVDIGGDISLIYKAGSLVDATVYLPCHGQGRVIKSNIDALDITVVDLPEHVELDGYNFKAGETKDGEHCIVYESDLSLNVWIRSIDSDGTEIWEQQDTIPLAAAFDGLTEGITQDMDSIIDIVQVRCGYVYLSRKCMTLQGPHQYWFFSLSLETLELELLHQGSYNGYVHPYVMAWPSSLVADDVDSRFSLG